jgi:hypothetical protein
MRQRVQLGLIFREVMIGNVVKIKGQLRRMLLRKISEHNSYANNE